MGLGRYDFPGWFTKRNDIIGVHGRNETLCGNLGDSKTSYGSLQNPTLGTLVWGPGPGPPGTLLGRVTGPGGDGPYPG